MSIWCPSVHRKYGTSEGRPNSVHYGRPLNTTIGRPTDVHFQPIQGRHVCKFISWTISSFIYFEVLCTKMFFILQSPKILNISLWVWNAAFEKVPRMPGEVWKKTNQIFSSFLIWTNQFSVSFNAFLELRIFFTVAGWR